jgi:hypothetical protein
MAGVAGKDIVYRLSDNNGGRDPYASDPATHWRTKVLRQLVLSCDCAGFVAWALGYDRKQPGFGGWDWVNCDSMLIEAKQNNEVWFDFVETPMPGDLVVFPSIDADNDGDRDRVGHVGVVVEVLKGWQPGRFDLLRVVHCSMGNQRKFKRAIMETTAEVWARADVYKGKMQQNWRARFLRYRGFVQASPPPVEAPHTPIVTRPTLQLGDKGPFVTALQRHLGLVPDGVFGPLTLAAVKKFQHDKGLDVDGVVGPKTWAKIP